MNNQMIKGLDYKNQMISELYNNQNMIGKLENYVVKVLSNYMIE